MGEAGWGRFRVYSMHRDYHKLWKLLQFTMVCLPSCRSSS